MAVPGEKEVKLTCRHVWKVYGPEADRFFTAGNGDVADAASLMETINESGHIGAACDVSFDVHNGEIFVIMGLSGSGKSTIVRCLSRLVEPTAGEVILDDEDLLRVSRDRLIDIRRHKMGMVFQHFGLLPHLSSGRERRIPAADPGNRQGRATRPGDGNDRSCRVCRDARRATRGSCPAVSSSASASRRSLAVEPELWFLDEPFSALDPLIRRQMQDEFLRLQQMLHKTIVFITHDFLEALRLADRIAIMKDGRIVQIGTPAEVVMQPADDYVSEFTQDVPRVKVITAGDIVTGGAVPVTDDVVDEHATLEEIMPRFASGSDVIAVTSGEGNIVGSITAQKVLSALADAPAGRDMA